MGKPYRLAFLSLYLPIACAAQTPAVITVPGIKTEVVPSKIFGPGVGSFLVTNESQIAITAMHFTFGCYTPKQMQNSIFDSLLYVPDRPIEPQQNRTSRFGSQEIPTCPSGVDAAMFADGHVEGDPKAIDKIYSWRRGFDKGITFAIPLVAAIAQSEGERSHAVTSLAEKSNQVNQDLAVDVDERMAEVFLLRTVIECLQKEQQLGTPSDRTRAREPNVGDVMRAENLDHTQAVAYVLGRKLTEWKSDLIGHLTTPSGKQ